MKIRLKIDSGNNCLRQYPESIVTIPKHLPIASISRQQEVIIPGDIVWCQFILRQWPYYISEQYWFLFPILHFENPL